ncbi:MAG: alpha-amylase, partial [Marivirga sp.]|nr:alpha-amylase [Marivirga sp.]
EAGLNKRLKFFEKDTISWEDRDKYFEFYQKLNQLKADNPALWNGSYGSMPEKIEDDNKNVFSFKRIKDQNTVIGLINMSASPQVIMLTDKEISGNFNDVFTGRTYTMGQLKLEPWQYLIFIR